MGQFKWLVYLMFCLTIADSEPSCPPECSCHDNIVRCQGPNISSIPADIPGNTKVLIIRDTTITALEYSSFSKLSSLTELYLVWNKISEIEIGVFDGLLKLTSLDLQHNSLTLSNDVYRRGVFRNLTKVESLLLHANSEVCEETLTYPDEIGNSFPNLKFLTMDGLCNKTFPFAYSQLSMLQNLSLSGHYGRCELNSLFNDTFEAFGKINLQNLDISKCSINYVEANSLAPLHSLEIINLSFQQFSSVYTVSQAFQGLQNNTNIRYINMNSVMILGSYTIAEDAIKPIFTTNLEQMYFNDNFVTWVEYGWFKSMPRTIQTISLRGNFIIARFSVFSYLSAFTLQNLKAIYFSTVRFGNNATYTKIPVIIPENLESFEISGVITATPFSGVNIYIKNNLKSIAMVDSVIPELNGYLTGLRKLETVTFANLNCKTISLGFFKDCPSLKIFNMSSNFLGEYISRDINCDFLNGVLTLEILDLSKNNIREIPWCMFKMLKGLKRVYMHTNSMINFHATLENVRNLSHLDLATNQISFFDSRLRDELTPLFSRNNLSIDLSDNHLKCSCDSLEFLKWIQGHQCKFVSIDKYKCFYDNGTIANLSNIDAIVNSFDRECNSFSTLLDITVAVFISYICVILSAVVYKKRMHLFYWYHAIKRSSSRVAVPVSESEFKFDAFVSFADSELEFVKDSMLHACEKENGLKLCIHFRDFIPGTMIAENIVNAIHASRKTIIILSDTYLTSNWCMYEFNMARMESIYSDRETLIIIKYENLNSRNLTLDILEAMKSQTYGVMPSDLEERATFWKLLVGAVRGDDISSNF